MPYGGKRRRFQRIQRKLPKTVELHFRNGVERIDLREALTFTDSTAEKRLKSVGHSLQKWHEVRAYLRRALVALEKKRQKIYSKAFRIVQFKLKHQDQAWNKAVVEGAILESSPEYEKVYDQISDLEQDLEIAEGVIKALEVMSYKLGDFYKYKAAELNAFKS